MLEAEVQRVLSNLHLIAWTINNAASSVKNTLDTKKVELTSFKSWEDKHHWSFLRIHCWNLVAGCCVTEFKYPHEAPHRRPSSTEPAMLDSVWLIIPLLVTKYWLILHYYIWCSSVRHENGETYRCYWSKRKTIQNTRVWYTLALKWTV